MSYYSTLAQHGDFTGSDDGNTTPFRGGGGDNPYVLATHGRRGTPGGNQFHANSPSLNSMGNINRFPVKHNSVTYYLAPRPAPTDDRELKSRVFEDSVTVIRSSDERNWKTKADFLCSRFQYLIAGKQAAHKTDEYKNPISACFTWT